MKSNNRFDHVIVIMFENMYRSYVMENDYFKSLAEQGIDMENYFGAMHPSQTNYIASIAGELCNVTDDDQPSPLEQQTIVDLIEDRGLSWKAYMDGYSPVPWSEGLDPSDRFPYVIKHDPFSSFKNIQNSQERWEKIDNQFGFYDDVANGTLPNYCWFTPDMWNDGHYLVGTESGPEERAPALVDQQANWLRYFFGNLQFPGPNSILPDNTLVVVTFDEADFEADWDKGKKYTYDGPNQVYTVLLGDGLEPGKQAEGYNHYSLLKTVEKNFGLDNLGKNDADSNWFQFLNDKSFTWSQAETLNCLPDSVGHLALAYQGDQLILACTVDEEIQIWFSDGNDWLLSGSLINTQLNDLALCQKSGCENVDLYFSDVNGINTCSVLDLEGLTQIVAGPTNKLSVHQVWNGFATMLVWSDAEGDLWSLCKLAADTVWPSTPVALNKRSDGDFCLASIGPSLYLIYQTENQSMQVLSYNLADFNVVTYLATQWSGPYDNTTVNKWNPTSFPVAHFSHMASPVTPDEEEPLTQVYLGSGSFAASTLDGVIHFTHENTEGNALQTQTLSIAGLMTPKLPVSYNRSDETTTSNGYGGLAEAGWSEQKVLLNEGAYCSAMAATENRVSFVYRSKLDGKLRRMDGECL